MRKSKRVDLLLSHFITLFACALLVIWLAGCGEEREDILPEDTPQPRVYQHLILNGGTRTAFNPTGASASPPASRFPNR